MIAEVAATFSAAWQETATHSVPEPEDLRLGSNHAKNLETAAVLYADLNSSTSMVDNHEWWFSAEVYKNYLRCAAQIVRSEGGVVTAYAGDRIMAVFAGDSKCTAAVRCAMKIHYAVVEIIRPALAAQYPGTKFLLNHVVAVDSTQLRAARIGVRGDNDLVWIGRAANYAAKLTTFSSKPLWITKAVFDTMHDSVKYRSGAPMWEARTWRSMSNLPVYCSTWRWQIS